MSQIKVLDPSTFTVKVISFEGKTLHEATLYYLSGNHTYYDIELGEHLYSENVLEDISQLMPIPVRVAMELTYIRQLCDEHKASYFRLIDL